MTDSKDPLFDPDWHHTDEAAQCIHAVGLFSIEWNMVEHQFTITLANFMGGLFIGQSVATTIGNQTKAELLMKFFSIKPELASGVPIIENICKIYNRLRENRNILMHSHSIVPRANEKIEFRRAHPKSPMGHVGSLTSIEEIYQNIAATLALSQALTFVWIKTAPDKNINKRGQKWPKTMPIPKNFEQLPLEKFPSAEEL